jgi:hypothetical protein
MMTALSRGPAAMTARKRCEPMTHRGMTAAIASGQLERPDLSTKASYHGLLLSARSAIRSLGRVPQTGSCLDQGTRMPT